MFLNHVELEQYTGYKRPSDQIKALRKNGVPFDLARNGRPVVLKEAVEQRLSFQNKSYSAKRVALNLSPITRKGDKT